LREKHTTLAFSRGIRHHSSLNDNRSMR